MPDDNDGYEVFVGVARTDDATAKPATLEDAFADAYEKGKSKTGKTRYRLVDIEISGTNPISEYKVVLTGH